MAGSVNKAIILGNLGSDPEQRRTQNGALVVNLSVATNEVWTDRDSNEKREETEWHRVVLFGRTAEVAAEYLKKGSKVYIEGKIQTRKYQDQRTGQDRYTTEIRGRELHMLDSRSDGGPRQYGGSQESGYRQSSSDNYSKPSSPQPAEPQGMPDVPDDPMDDIPW